MNFTFYSNKAKEEHLDKTNFLSNETTITGEIKDSCDILQPQLIVYANVFNCNYCYIPLFQRYYFVTGFTRLDNKRLQVFCSVDVLMSFKDEIKNYSVIVTRSTDKYNAFLKDSSIALQNNNFVITKKISENLFKSNLLNVDDYVYALTVINKKGVDV